MTIKSNVESTPLLEYFLKKGMPHFQQGDLDGSCGIYCLAMVLEYFGLLDQNNDLRSRGRLVKYFKKTFPNDPMLLNGSHAKDLLKIDGFKGILRLNKISISRKSPIKQYECIKECVEQNMPVILGYNWKEDSGGHWVVVVGAGIWYKKPSLFFMCPSRNTCIGEFGGTLFNDYALLRKSGWHLEYDGNLPIKFTTAIAANTIVED